MFTMDNLRLILIIAAVIIIGGIYIWDRVQSRKQSRRQTVSPVRQESRENPGLVISARPKDEELQAGIDEMDGFFIDIEPDLDEDASGEIFISRDPNVKPVRRPISESLAIPEQTDAFSEDTPAQKPSEPVPEPGTVITLFVVATGDRQFAGPDIRAALDGLGFKFGEMNIFHHHGKGALLSERSLFSLVNMYEPGYFEIDKMGEFHTRGLSLFLQLPMKQDPTIVFPYMLEITQRLAKRLGGEVLGPGRKPLDEAALKTIHILIEPYAG